jgi:hypothetical protein
MTRETRREKSVAEGTPHNPVNGTIDFSPSQALCLRWWREASAALRHCSTEREISSKRIKQFTHELSRLWVLFIEVCFSVSRG